VRFFVRRVRDVCGEEAWRFARRRVFSKPGAPPVSNFDEMLEFASTIQLPIGAFQRAGITAMTLPSA
jgi:hypothetical protein